MTHQKITKVLHQIGLPSFKKKGEGYRLSRPMRGRGVIITWKPMPEDPIEHQRRMHIINEALGISGFLTETRYIIGRPVVVVKGRRE